MSLYQPNHVYRCMVFDNEDRKAKVQFVAVNCRERKIPLGQVVEVEGKYLAVLENRGMFLPTVEDDPRTGQQRSVRNQWMPRFGISVIADLTAGTPLVTAPIPSGGIILEPGKVDPATIEGKSTIELRTMCAERGIRYPSKASKEDLIQLLTTE